MIVMHRKNGNWELFDEEDIIAVYLSPRDKTEITRLDEDADVYMTYAVERGYTDDFLIKVVSQARTLAEAKVKTRKAKKDEQW